jgi:hypothetical protein
MNMHPPQEPYNPIQPADSMSYIRIFHASPDAPAVDIYANRNLIAKGLAYKQITNYIPVSPGNYNIQVFPAGQQRNPVINTNIAVTPRSTYTVAAVGTLSNIGLLPIPEIYKPTVPMDILRKSYVRFVHLSPNAPAVDVTLANGTKLFENVKYKNYTNYIIVDSGNYTLLVKPSGSNQTVLTIPNIYLSPRMIYSIYAVGLVGNNPPLEAVMSLDGNYT